MKRDFMRLGDIGGSVFGIRRVYICPGILGAFPIPQHAHDILCDVYADGTAEGVIFEGDIAFIVHSRNVASVIGGVTHVSAAAIAGNVLHDVGIGDIELIRFPHCHRCGLNIHWHLIQWCHGEADFI